MSISCHCYCRLGAHLSDLDRTAKKGAACVLVPGLVPEARGHTLEKRTHLLCQWGEWAKRGRRGPRPPSARAGLRSTIATAQALGRPARTSHLPVTAA